jgi:hypothetical protein
MTAGRLPGITSDARSNAADNTATLQAAHDEARNQWLAAKSNVADANAALEDARRAFFETMQALEDAGPKPYSREWFIAEAAAANVLYESLPSLVKVNMVFAGAYLNSEPTGRAE